MLILCNVYRDSKKNMLRISGKNIAMVKMKHCDDSNCSLRWFKLFIAMIQSTYRIMIHLMWFCVLSLKVVWRCGNRCGKDKHPFYILWRKSTEFPLVWLCVYLFKSLIISVYA